MIQRTELLCLLVALLATTNACTESGPAQELAAAPAVEPRPAAPPEPGTIEGVSKTMAVQGAYAPLALDRVARVTLADGRLVVHGTSSDVTLDLPAGADASRTTAHWALVTEANLESGRRQFTFTHSESLDEFSIELPESQGSVRYGGFERRGGGEVLVFAWGESSATYWGWVTIAPLAARSH